MCGPLPNGECSCDCQCVTGFRSQGNFGACDCNDNNANCLTATVRTSFSLRARSENHCGVLGRVWNVPITALVSAIDAYARRNTTTVASVNSVR